MRLIIVFTNIIVILKNMAIFFFISKYSFLADFLNDLNEFNKLKTQKGKAKGKKYMFMIQHQNYITNC